MLREAMHTQTNGHSHLYVDSKMPNSEIQRGSGTGETGQKLTEHSALSEDRNEIPSTHVGWLIRDLTFSSGLLGHCYTCAHVA